MKVKNLVKIVTPFLIFAIAGAVFASTLFPNQGGTGTNQVPTNGQFLVGNPSSTYTPVSSSSARGIIGYSAGTGIGISAGGVITNSLPNNNTTTTVNNASGAVTLAYATSGQSGIQIASSSSGGAFTWTFSQPTSTASVAGYLAPGDFNTFNAKQNNISWPIPVASTSLAVTTPIVLTTNTLSLLSTGYVSSTAAGNGISVNQTTGAVVITNTQPHVTSTITAGGGTATGNAFIYATSSTGIISILCGTSTCTWNTTASSTWGLVPSARNINTTSPITGGGALTGDLTIACATCQLQASSTINSGVGPWKLLGTANQINIASTTGGASTTYTFSTPQNIDTAADVQFGSVTSTRAKVTATTTLATSNGFVGIGTTTPAYPLTVGDNLNGTNAYIALSPTSTSGISSLFQIKGTHIVATSTVPTVSSCGSSPSVVGTDMAGTITVGSGVVSSCTFTFAAKWVNAPACIADSNTAIASQTVTVTTSTMVIGGTSLTSDVIPYICIGNES